jgi:Tfp pilus assembly major pilin PilA
LDFSFIRHQGFVSIPAYQDYMIRAQVTEGLNAVRQYQAAIAD